MIIFNKVIHFIGQNYQIAISPNLGKVFVLHA